MARRKRPVVMRDIVQFIREYVVMSDDQLVTVAAWIVHTHCIRAFDQTPYLSVTSPEKQCGKSRLLETVELLVARPWMTILPSEAVVYRQVHLTTPTLMLDEIDTIFNPRSADRYEGLRALLNAGHRRGATVPRCVGSSNKIVEFRTFCPKVLAGIGTLPDTVSDRSVPIRLERRSRDQPIARFTRRTVEPLAEPLRDRIEHWAEQNTEALIDARPDMPDELSDRMQDGCEGLVAVADALGWGDEVRAALVALLTADRLDSTENMGRRLLRDLRTAFASHPGSRSAFTSSLLAELVTMPESTWANYYGRTFEDRDLASLLRPYGVRSTTVRGKTSRGEEKVAKGYKRDDLAAAWEKYLAPEQEVPDAE